MRMKNEAEVMKKINKIVNDGAEKLQLVADFDFTLTKQHVDGAPVPSSFGMFLSSKQIPASRVKRDEVLCVKYKAIELDPHVSLDDKVEAMNEWYLKTHGNLGGIKFDREEIHRAVRGPLRRAPGRDGGFVRQTEEARRPDPRVQRRRHGILSSRGILFDNVNVISNFLRFDGDTMNGFENAHRIIHPFNKNSHTVEHDYFKILHERTNVILMGDSLGDASMADIDANNCVLKIGFFYNGKACLSHSMEAFDIVLLDDQTMDVALEIVDLVP